MTQGRVLSGRREMRAGLPGALLRHRPGKSAVLPSGDILCHLYFVKTASPTKGFRRLAGGDPRGPQRTQPCSWSEGHRARVCTPENIFWCRDENWQSIDLLCLSCLVICCCCFSGTFHKPGYLASPAKSKDLATSLCVCSCNPWS